MGRDLAFMGRIATYGWNGGASPRGISVNEETAPLIDARGRATVTGDGNVCFLTAPGNPEVCQPKTPLTYLNAGVRRVGASGSFDVGNWSGTSGTTYTVSANAGVLTSTQSGGSPY